MKKDGESKPQNYKINQSQSFFLHFYEFYFYSGKIFNRSSRKWSSNQTQEYIYDDFTNDNNNSENEILKVPIFLSNVEKFILNLRVHISSYSSKR